MNLSDLISEVMTITGRQDLVNETITAIKAATLKAHHSDYYWKDIFECGVQFNTAEYIQDLDYRSVIPYYRSVKYLRKYDVTTSPATPGKFLTLVPPELVLDSYQVQKQDIFYGAGAYLHINSSTKEYIYLFGSYVNPDITSSGYNSWIAIDHPYAIVFDAAGTVFKAIGKDEETANYRALGQEQLAMLRTSNILVEGF